MKLLIVDDEPIIRQGIKALIKLEDLGINEVYEAENGEKAIELFKSYLPDIVLADINMPKMNGLDFSKTIKTLKPNVKIALITGYDYFDYAMAAIKIGVDDYVLKPVSKSDITALLTKLGDLVAKEKYADTIEAFKTEDDQAMIGSSTVTYEDTKSYKTQMAEYLSQNLYDESLSLSAMAESLNLSSGYLSGLFKKVYGLSFTGYVQKQRIEKAKILLLSTELKNYEISTAVGISDPNYFSAAFKKITGYSPNQYRENQKV